MQFFFLRGRVTTFLLLFFLQMVTLFQTLQTDRFKSCFQVLVVIFSTLSVHYKYITYTYTNYTHIYAYICMQLQKSWQLERKQTPTPNTTLEGHQNLLLFSKTNNITAIQKLSTWTKKVSQVHSNRSKQIFTRGCFSKRPQ